MTHEQLPAPPAAVWTREWNDDNSTNATHHFRALYPFEVENAPPIGVRVAIDITPIYHLQSSGAMAEIFDGLQWHVIAALPSSMLRSAQRERAIWKFDPDGQPFDVARLLEDVRLAYRYRAPGPAEFALMAQQRLLVTESAIVVNEVES